MRFAGRTAPQRQPGRGALWAWVFVSGLLWGLLLMAAAVGLSQAERSPGAPVQQPGVQPHPMALQERDAIVGAGPSSFLPHQLLVARGRAKFQPPRQSSLQLIRERQDAIIMAFSQRMRDASEPGAASHRADRPRLISRPLRGPPSRA